MNDIISLRDSRATLKQLTDYLKLTLSLWALEEGLNPEEARGITQCLEGAQTILSWWQARQEEVLSC
jgi:hypothetical protein